MGSQQIGSYSYWTFIEKYYPKYFSCSDILLSDILNRKITGEQVCEEDEAMIKGWNVEAQLCELNHIIFSKALINYMDLVKT